VPIPFRDQDERDEWGTAAYLRLAPDPDRPGYRGALFQINARGEPVEFTYNRVETPNSFLWRPADVRRAALRRLTASLLAACPQVPRLLLALAAETPSELFCQDVQVAVPVARVTVGLETAGYSTLEAPETLESPWAPDAAGEAAPAHAMSVAPDPAMTATPDQAMGAAPDRPGAAAPAPPTHLFWYPAPPAEGSLERAFARHLTAHGLLLEPFERAAVGLAEVYGAADAIRP
jgi:hypothetical protein